MKKIFLVLVLVLTSVVGKAQSLITFKADTAYLFEYSENLNFKEAWDNGTVTNLKTIRTYEESFRNWTIDLNRKEFQFGEFEPWKIIAVEEENNKLVYKDGVGEVYKIFIMKNTNTGQDMVFFLGPPKDGKILGGFVYPREMVVL